MVDCQLNRNEDLHSYIILHKSRFGCEAKEESIFYIVPMNICGV